MSEVHSIASAVAAFQKHFARDVTFGARAYTAEELELLDRIEGMSQPKLEAENLASALKALWNAVQSGELDEEDLANTIWLLHEHARLVADAINAAFGAAILRYEARLAAEEQKAAAPEAEA
ncbi:hypothetical protein MIN45_P0870 [Methylomarinovum tepidoasis]|uniref:Uncharacterized protein n=1 Tax=Methylomarinovum tepidoasis TaxID=2840183 RepID=A0AAU9CCJ9_9GAMM|nr:hypothetical protein [Methylomarinovum sp. IN45]BCX88501.1 hypothetical protein MIN45_P0870 [Methylomarinovum sp. IN45]